MKIRCLLVDDEPPALDVLLSHISNSSGLEVVATCKNAIEALDVLQHKAVDLLFLDIKMPKLLGTDLIKTLSNPPKIIFVTAYRDFALDGFELDVVDYIVKPVSFDRFIKAVSKAKKMIGQESVASGGEGKATHEAFVYLRVDRAMQKFFVNEILYIESLKDYVRIFLNSGKYYVIKQSISALEKLLSEYKFIRVHRSYMVSIKQITGYTNSSVKLGQQDIPIGRLYKQQVMSTLRPV